MTDVSDLPALQEAARIIDRLDPHRQRKALAFILEHCGFSLQPAAKRIPAAPTSPGNRSELAAIENLLDLFDGMERAEHGPAVAYLAAKYDAKAVAAYKPPARGPAPRRKRAYS